MKITSVEDYVDEVCEVYPDIPRDEIKRILVYGWKMIIQYVAQGNDVQILSPNFFMFFGEIPVSALSAFRKYCFKLSKRISYMFKRTKAKWDGYYYFALNDKQYIDYLQQSRRKIKIFKNIMLFKLLEECKIKEHNKRYIFRLSEDKTDWIRKFYPELRTRNAELIIQRDPLKMQDILVSENKFKYIQQ